MRRMQSEFQQALNELEAGKVDRAHTLVDRWRSRPGWESHVHLLRGVQFEVEGRHAQALPELLAVEPAGALRPDALRWTSVCLYHAGRPTDAMRVMQTLAVERPDDRRAPRFLARIYHELGAMDACLAQLEEVARLEPDDFFAWRLMGLVYREDRGQDARAIECYRKALSRSPPADQRRAIVRELADSLVGVRDYSAALDLLESENLETQTEDSQILALRAECLLSQGAVDAARRVLDRALRCNPSEHRALMLQAQICLDDRDPSGAIVPLESILEHDAHDYPARYLLSQALRRAGRELEADEQLARMEESSALREQLRGLYREAMRDPDDSAVRERIAALCRRLDRPALAGVWERAAAVSRQAANSAGPP